MLKRTVDVKNVLVAERMRCVNESQLLAEVHRILDTVAVKSLPDGDEDEIDAKPNDFVFDLLETDNIFHISHIRKVCIEFRLRFLDIRYFKNPLPEDAVEAIQSLEMNHQTRISGLKIAAPSKAFRLLNYDDPLLFVPLGNDYFYLVHKWGNDMAASRKWMVMPVKNIWNFLVFCVILSFITALLVPDNRLSQNVPMASVIIFLFAFKSFFAVIMYAFFMTGRKFNDGMWDSVFYNH